MMKVYLINCNLIFVSRIAQEDSNCGIWAPVFGCRYRWNLPWSNLLEKNETRAVKGKKITVFVVEEIQN